MREIFLLFGLVGLLAIGSCKESPPTPPTSDPPLKDPRAYSWTVDTISYPGTFQTTMLDIWGSSPTDVFAAGRTDINAGHMYHYDGQRWEPVRLTVPEGGAIPYSVTLYSIHGFSGSDIYAVGNRNYHDPMTGRFYDSTSIIHYDGTWWRDVPIKRSYGYLNTVFGISPTDIWAGGWGLYHFDGAGWSRIGFDTTIFIGHISGSRASDLYGIGFRDDTPPHDSSAYLLFHYDGERWQGIDSFLITPQTPTWKFGYSLWTSPAGKTYSAAYGVYLKESASWRELLHNDWPTRMQGCTDNNIFAFGDLGRVFHWNGADWRRLSQIENSRLILVSGWITPEETFIVGHDGRKTYVLRGK